MILKKKYIYFLKIAIISVFIIFIAKTTLAEKYNSLTKSYYGSLLAGQIAKYNSENLIASEFYGFASKKNPKNSKLLNLSLMSLILSGQIEEAVKKLNYSDNNDISTGSEVEKLLFFVSLVKEKKYNDAYNLLKANKDFLISDKISPIINAWLANNFNSAKKYLEKFPYKSEGLVMFDIYTHHLAYINILYNNNNRAIEIFEKALDQDQEEKIRTLYFYYNLLGSRTDAKSNKIIKNFSYNYPDHSLNIYIKKNIFNGFSLKNPSDGISESFFNIAEILYSQGMYETSIAFCNLSIYLNTENYINYYLLGQNYQMLGRNNKAINALLKIPLNNYLGWNTYLRLVDLFMQSNDFNTAKGYINKLKSFSKDRKDVYYKAGELFHNGKLYDDAIKSFTDAISFISKPEKKDWYLYYSRGMSYERSKKWKKAEKDFLYALDLFPNQPLVLNYLGYSWIDFGMKLEKAENLIKEAVKLRPNDGYFVDSLGWAYYRQGKYQKAVEELEKAVSLVPNDPIINDHLGDALWRAGYKNEAKFQWKRVLIYNPENELKENINFKLKKGL